jgi:hypothetical protein
MLTLTTFSQDDPAAFRTLVSFAMHSRYQQYGEHYWIEREDAKSMKSINMSTNRMLADSLSDELSIQPMRGLTATEDQSRDFNSMR